MTTGHSVTETPSCQTDTDVGPEGLSWESTPFVCLCVPVPLWLVKGEECRE